MEERRCNKGSKGVLKGEKIATVAVYLGGDNHLHFGIHPDGVDPEKKFRGNKCFKKDGVTPREDNCGWVEPFRFLDQNLPHSDTIVSEKTVEVAPGTEGFVAWIGDKCANASLAWKATYNTNTELFGAAKDIQKTCGTVKDSYISNASPAQSPSMTERSKQNFLQWVGEFLKEKFSWVGDLLSLGATARAAGIGYDDYERSIASSYEAVLYADGTMKLKQPELLAKVYSIDIQKLETNPLFSNHPVTLTNGTKKNGTSYPNMIVNDYWIRKGTSSASAHDTTFTFAELKHPNTEWRVQVKNSGKGTKANGKTVTVQAYLWRVKESGDETMVEGIGKEEVNKEMKSGATTTEHHGVGDIIAQAKYPGKYFMAVCLITANSLIEENKADNCKGNYYFTLVNQSDLVAISASSNDNKSIYLQGETASFHASFRLDGDNFPKNANARVAWRLVGPAFPEGKIMETDRVKSTTLANKRGETHGENTTFPIDFAPGEYDLYAIVNPECTLKETNCGNNQVAFHFRVDAQVVDDGGDEMPPPGGTPDPNPPSGGTDPGTTPPPDTAYRFPWKYFVQ